MIIYNPASEASNDFSKAKIEIYQRLRYINSEIIYGSDRSSICNSSCETCACMIKQQKLLRRYQACSRKNKNKHLCTCPQAECDKFLSTSINHNSSLVEAAGALATICSASALALAFASFSRFLFSRFRRFASSFSALRSTAAKGWSAFSGQYPAGKGHTGTSSPVPSVCTCTRAVWDEQNQKPGVCRCMQYMHRAIGPIGKPSQQWKQVGITRSMVLPYREPPLFSTRVQWWAPVARKSRFSTSTVA